MSQLYIYIHENFVRIQPMVHKKLWRQESVMPIKCHANANTNAGAEANRIHTKINMSLSPLVCVVCVCVCMLREGEHRNNANIL